MGTVLQLKGAVKEYPVRGGAPIRALDSVEFGVEAGEFVVVTGRSGSGKTTMLNIAAGLTRPTAGSAAIEGVDVWSGSDVDRAALRNERVGFVFQFPSLVPTLTLSENVALPTTFSRSRTGTPESAERRAHELLELVGLAERAAARPCELSAGQQQRVVIARALVGRPSILIADEPTSNLDAETESEIIALFQRINRDDGVTVVMVTHGTDLVRSGKRHVGLAGGRIVADARVSDVR